MLAAVRGKWRAGDQILVGEALYDAAEIASIDRKFGTERLSREIVAMGEFEQHAGFGQRVRAGQQMLVEHADRPGVAAVEVPDGSDL